MIHLKKHLAILLSALLLFTSGMTAIAFEPETVESAGEVTEAIPETPAKTLTDETEIDIPLIDLEKGKLVFYQNFDSENAAPATVDYVDETYLTISKIYPTGATLTVETDPVDETNKVLKLTNAGSSWHQYAVGMNFPLKEGKYYATYRHAGEGGKLNGYMQRWFTTPNPVNSTGVAKDDLISVNLDCGGLNSNPKTWYNTTLTGVCKTVDGILKFGKNEDTLFPMSGTTPMQNIREFRITPNGGNLYVDNLRIYFYPANAFTISDGTTVQMIEQTADDPIFTFPEVPGVYFYVDKNDFSRTYLPNAKVECSELLGGAFIPVDVPLIADGKGELVLYTNFENSDKNVLTYTNPAYTSIKTFKAYRSDGSESITIVTDPTDKAGKNHALRVYSSNAATHRLAVPEFDDIAILNSAYTVDSKYMLVDPSNFKQIYFRFTNKDGGDHTSSRTVALDKYPPAELTWTQLSLTPNNLADMNKGIRSFGYQMNMKAGKETTYYIDNMALYAYPQNAVMFKPSLRSKDVQIIREDDLNAEDMTYTFPTPEALGYELEEDAVFYGWASADGKQMYKPGETVQYSALDHQTFYPFVQSTNENAMGYAFGGENKNLNHIQSMNSREKIQDGIRSVLRLVSYKCWNDSQNQKCWAVDARVGMPVGEAQAFDGTEFPIVTYTYKISNAQKVPDTYKNDKNYDPAKPEYVNAQPIGIQETKYILWYYTKKEGANDPFIANKGENKIGGATLTGYTDGKYHTATFNMLSEKSNSKDPYLGGKIYGFAVDPRRDATWNAEIYIDSIRAYRYGFTTVTYDTNAPAGATVVHEVAPDTDRGLGKGYLLTDEQPEVEGYMFAGWATKPNAAANETVSSITLGGDTTVYAVWVDAKPVNTMQTSIRPATSAFSAGIRFRSTVSAFVRGVADEYGYIIARADQLNGVALEFGTDAPTYKNEGKNFTGTTADGVKYTGAVNYSKANDIEIIYEEKANGDADFTVVMIGLDKSYKKDGTTYANRYNVAFTARPYVKIGGTCFYGESCTKSLKERAAELLENTDLSEAEKSLYQEIVDTAEDTITATQGE